eukprot:gene9940-7379_t
MRLATTTPADCLRRPFAEVKALLPELAEQPVARAHWGKHGACRRVSAATRIAIAAVVAAAAAAPAAPPPPVGPIRRPPLRGPPLRLATATPEDCFCRPLSEVHALLPTVAEQPICRAFWARLDGLCAATRAAIAAMVGRLLAERREAAALPEPAPAGPPPGPAHWRCP